MPSSLLKFVKTLSVTIGGRKYPVVKIGNQLWMAENLDYKFQVNGSQIPVGQSGTPTTPAAWYYNNDETTYGIDGRKYGLLYNWYAANYLETNKSTMLPSGWHVPGYTEWQALFDAVGGYQIAGKKLKSSTYWISGAGTDDYGFNLLPAGLYWGGFGDDGDMNDLWCSGDSGINAEYYRFTTSDSISYNPGIRDKKYGYSIRLVKTIT